MSISPATNLRQALNGGLWREFANVRPKWRRMIEENPPKDILELSPKIQVLANVARREPTPKEKQYMDSSHAGAMAKRDYEGQTVITLNKDTPAEDLLPVIKHEIVHALQNLERCIQSPVPQRSGTKQLPTLAERLQDPSMRMLTRFDEEAHYFISIPFSEYSDVSRHEILSGSNPIKIPSGDASLDELQIFAKQFVNAVLSPIKGVLRKILESPSKEAIRVFKGSCLDEIHAHTLTSNMRQIDSEHKNMILEDFINIQHYHQMYRLCQEEERRRRKGT